MGGRPPKPAGSKARRHKDYALPIEISYSPTGRPELPKTSRDPETGAAVPINWHPLTLDWWEDWVDSPQASIFSTSDWRSLVTTAFIADRFYCTSSVQAAAELRQREAAFGATPLDRLRLRMHFLEVENAEDKAGDRRARKGATGVKPPATGRYAGLAAVGDE